MLKNKVLWAGSALLAGLFACSTQVSGGVSEETNTVAGVLTDKNGGNVSGAIVLAKHVSVDTLSFVDTTDEKGRFAFPISLHGVYGISSDLDSLASYSMVEFLGKKLSVEMKLKGMVSFSGRVVLDSVLQQHVEVRLPGTEWITETDSTGTFHFDGIPAGEFALVVSSPDPIRYLDAAYVVAINADNTRLSGPMPTFQLSSALYGASDVSMVGSSELQLPLSTEYGLISWWTMDNLSTSGNRRSIQDDRGHSDGILLYGEAMLTEGFSGKALSLSGADQFGVVEKDNGALTGADELTLETFLSVDSLSLKDCFRKNIIGKVGFGSEEDHSVFSLALINKECGAEDSRLAFFIADGSGDSLSCENVVISSKPMEFGSWMQVVVVLENGILKMYKNGVLDNEAETSVKTLQESDESIFFGKENLNLLLDDVRLSKTAITSADVLYRYNLKGGAK